MARSAVVTGMGVVAPAGTSLATFWDGMLSGRSFATSVEASIPELPLIGCVVPDDGWDEGLSHAEKRRLDRIVQLGLAAADQAVAASTLRELDVPPDRLGFVAAIGFGGISSVTAAHHALLDRGPRKVSPFAVPTVMPSALAAFGAIRYGVHGPTMTATSACASGTHGIIEAARLIADGSADVVIVAGSEAPLDTLPMACFTRMDAMASATGIPGEQSRPFDVARAGFVLGEGAGSMVLMEEGLAARYDINALARVSGWSVTTDASHITAPDAAGTRARRCIEAALESGGHRPEDIGHVNAHGTGTVLNDLAESRALSGAFGAYAVPVTSAKGAIGHLMGGAGAVEAVLAIQSMRAQTVSVTVNCDELDPQIQLDVVADEPRSIPLAPVLSCSFGFGGVNASVTLAPL